MVLSASLDDYNQTILHKNENIINFINIKHRNSRYRPNGPLCPLGRLYYWQLKKVSKHKQKIWLKKKLDITHKIIVRDLTNGNLLPLVQQLHTQPQTWITWGTNLKLIYVLMVTGAITKTSTLATISHKPAGEENPYLWFGYGQLFNHTRGQVPV